MAGPGPTLRSATSTTSARASLTLGGGLLAALVVVAPVVIAVAIFARIADQPDTYIVVVEVSPLETKHLPRLGGSRA